MITGYDHVQVAIPVSSEALARAYYGDVLGMTELVKPPALAVRGGCWFAAGDAVLHLGVAKPFVPAGKAHPAFLVTDLDELAGAVRAGDSSSPGRAGRSRVSGGSIRWTRSATAWSSRPGEDLPAAGGGGRPGAGTD